jgi:hypothetical protein
MIRAVQGLVQDNEDKWLGKLAGKRAEAEEQIAEAKRLLAEANRTMGEVGRSEGCIRRTADNLPGRHISIDLLGVKEPPEPLDAAALMGGLSS